MLISNFTKAKVTYVGIRIVLDYLMPERRTLLIELFAGVHMNTSIGSGPFAAIMMFTFLISFAVLKFKAPILPGEEDEESKKFKILFLMLSIIGILQFSLDIYFKYFLSFNKMDAWVATGTLQLVVNYIIAPTFFIYSISKLKRYSLKQFYKYVIFPARKGIKHIRELSKLKPNPRVDIIE